MKSLKMYVGRIVKLRPERFARLLQRAKLTKVDMENRFLVGAANWKKRKLVCYGADLRFLVSPAEVVLV